MATNNFVVLEEYDIEQLLEDNEFPVNDPSALEYSMPLENGRRAAHVRPKCAELINDYLEQGGHPVTDSKVVLRTINGDSSRDKPDYRKGVKNQIGTLLSTATLSEDIPVEEWGSNKYSMNFEDNGEKLLDYTRLVYFDRALGILSDEDSFPHASSLPGHTSGREPMVDDDKWDALKVDDYQYDLEEYSFERGDFTTDSFTKPSDWIVGRDFLAYHKGLNNLNRDYRVNVSHEEVDLARFAVSYVRENKVPVP